MGLQNGVFLQRLEVCIRSSFVPVLSDNFLAIVDRAIVLDIESMTVTNLFKYVDDFFLLYKNTADQDVVSAIMDIFHTGSCGITFTSEKPKEGVLKVLDIFLSLYTDHLCWSFPPRSK